MQFLISLEGGSLFFSCRTISFIHYLRYDFYVEEKGRERIFQDIMQQTETVTTLLVLQLRYKPRQYTKRCRNITLVAFLTLILLQVVIEISINRPFGNSLVYKLLEKRSDDRSIYISESYLIMSQKILSSDHFR